MKQNPLISVVIPVYNREETIERAVKSAISQSYLNIEVIVVDDRSTDNTVEVINDVCAQSLTLLRHKENKGGSAARNTGIKEADGEYIAFLDSDDYWKKSKIEEQIELLTNEPEEVVAVYCDAERGFGEMRGLEKALTEIHDVLLDNERIGKEGGEELICDLLQKKMFVGAGTTLMVKAQTVRDMSGFDESFEKMQDLEFLIRLLKRGKLSFLNKKLAIIDTGEVPNPADFYQMKEKYLTEFSDEIMYWELQGYSILPIHRFDLAKAQFAEGEIREGVHLLLNSEASRIEDYFGLFKCMLAGIKNSSLL